MQMATVVTGATGFIRIAYNEEALVERGDRVKVLLRKTSNTKNIDSLDVEKVYGDVGDPDSLKPLFPDATRFSMPRVRIV